MKAHILISAEPGKVRLVKAKLQALGIAEVAAVAGVYDLIALVEADSPKDIGWAVLDVIQTTNGVTGTVTLIELE